MPPTVTFLSTFKLPSWSTRTLLVQEPNIPSNIPISTRVPKFSLSPTIRKLAFELSTPRPTGVPVILVFNKCAVDFPPTPLSNCNVELTNLTLPEPFGFKIISWLVLVVDNILLVIVKSPKSAEVTSVPVPPPPAPRVDSRYVKFSLIFVNAVRRLSPFPAFAEVPVLIYSMVIPIFSFGFCNPNVNT